jgi:hypothetical protein
MRRDMAHMNPAFEKKILLDVVDQIKGRRRRIETRKRIDMNSVRKRLDELGS